MTDNRTIFTLPRGADVCNRHEMASAVANRLKNFEALSVHSNSSIGHNHNKIIPVVNAESEPADNGSSDEEVFQRRLESGEFAAGARAFTDALKTIERNASQTRVTSTKMLFRSLEVGDSNHRLHSGGNLIELKSGSKNVIAMPLTRAGSNKVESEIKRLSLHSTSLDSTNLVKAFVSQGDSTYNSSGGTELSAIRSISTSRLVSERHMSQKLNLDATKVIKEDEEMVPVPYEVHWSTNNISVETMRECPRTFGEYNKQSITVFNPSALISRLTEYVVEDINIMRSGFVRHSSFESTTSDADNSTYPVDISGTLTFSRKALLLQSKSSECTGDLSKHCPRSNDDFVGSKASNVTIGEYVADKVETDSSEQAILICCNRSSINLDSSPMNGGGGDADKGISLAMSFPPASSALPVAVKKGKDNLKPIRY